MKDIVMKIAAAALAAVAVMTIASCQKPDNQTTMPEDTPDYEELIVGSWKNVKAESFNAGEFLSAVEYGDEGGIWVFFEDNIMEINEVLAYDWRIDEDRLVLEGSNEPNILTIIRLTRDEMVLDFPIIDDLTTIYHFVKEE